MSVSIKETIEMNGLCPILQKHISIDVTYNKLVLVGDRNEYAKTCGINCPHIEECPDPLECPVAHQRIYW